MQANKKKKKSVNSLINTLFGIDPELTTNTKQKEAMNSNKDVLMRDSNAGSIGVDTNQTCALEGFCTLVQLTDPAKASVLIAKMHTMQLYSSLFLQKHQRACLRRV
jgi:hypothetical protein